MEPIYYVYAWLMPDLIPYYVGKGKGYRAFTKSPNHYPPKDKSFIVFLQTKLSDSEALLLERVYIKLWGRKDLNTGILENRTSGGQGPSGHKQSQEHIAKVAAANRGKPQSPEHKIKNSIGHRGIPQTIESNVKRSASLKGIIPWNKGKSTPVETKAKQSASLLQFHTLKRSLV